ncbi:MAG: response regulator transcription factor [Opitutaceae bacterium]|nr:response regulator transcription factor [Opitutaceae bacterium]
MTFNGKILLADDEAHIRKFVALLLRKVGSPTLVEARDGQEAVEAYARENPDLVLLDVSMPVLDGIQALDRIRRADAEAVVIMLTSLTNRQTIEDCLRLGAVGYLRKDLPHPELLAELQRLITENFENPEATPPPAT